MKNLSLVLGLFVLGGCATIGEQATAEEPSVDTHLLLADIAIERRDFETAAVETLAAARVSSNPAIAERATRVAHELGMTAEGLESARRWLELSDADQGPLYFIGIFELRAGRVPRSADAFERFVRQYDQPDTGIVLVLDALTRETDAEGATAVMASLTQTFPGTAASHFALARLALRSGDFSTALTSAAAAAEADPDWLDAQLLHARTLLIAGETDEALAIAQRLAAESDELEIELQYAELLLSAGRSEEARARLDQILVDNPGLPEATRALAFLSLTEERLEDAAEHFGTLRAIPTYREESLYYLGRIAETEERYQAAIRSYQQVITGEHAVEAQLRAARIMFTELGNQDGAVQHLRTFSTANPDLKPRLLVAEAQLLLQMERLEEAMRAFDEALATSPDDPALKDAHAQLYVILAQDASGRGELERAEALLDEGLGRYAGHTGIRYAQALLYQEQGRMRRSVDVLEALVAEYPDNAAYLNALGYLLTDQFGRHEEARSYIQKALALNPDSGAIIDSMGWVLFKLGEYDAALQYLERAYVLEPEGEIAAHLVDARWASGDRTSALELLQSALEQDPGNRHLIEVGERLTQ